MIKRILVGALALSIGVALAALVILRPGASTEPVNAAAAQTMPTPREERAPAPAPPSDAVAPPPAPANAATADTEVANRNTFQVDASGNLIINEQTRLNLEALFARDNPQRARAVALGLARLLPQAAAAQAVDLVDRYDNFQRAQDQLHADEPPANEDDAAAQLDALHALRVEHFGPEVAKAFYGNEEQISRELLELMRIENDPGLTIAEKAERAQRVRDRSSAITAIEKRNREAVNPQPPR